MPAELLSKLVCCKCKSYLSIFPIYLNNEGVKPICGRCPIRDRAEYLHDTAYEGIAKHLRFPCMHHNNGCRVVMLPEQLLNHECRCIFRKLECPTKASRNCTWKGFPVELLKHYETSHKSFFIIDRKYPLDFTKKIDLQYLTAFQNEVFIVRMKIVPETETFTCSVEHIHQRKDSYIFMYFIKVETNNPTVFYLNPVQSTSGTILEATEFTRTQITEKLPAAKKLIAVIELIQKETDTLLLCEVHKVNYGKALPINWDQLETLRCMKCSLYMIPPIKQCSSGHTMCATCNLEAACHICKSPMSPNEDRHLTQCAQSVLYPCRYNSGGCRVILVNALIRTHEETCIFQTFECPFRETMQCNIRLTAPKAVHHVKNRHSKSIIPTDIVGLLLEDARHKLAASFIIVYASRVFQVSNIPYIFYV